jgi:hypothetical protein
MHHSLVYWMQTKKPILDKRLLDCQIRLLPFKTLPRTLFRRRLVSRGSLEQGPKKWGTY